jgi:hypothetical protein
MKIIALAAVVIALLAPLAEARGRSSAGRSTATRSARRSSRPKSPKCTTCTRDTKGRIARSSAARRDFQKSHPCPSTAKTSGACPGYVVDHVVPLKRGGADSPSNMQWQTVQAAKAKDKIE